MDYEKKYKKALERAKTLYNSVFVNNDVLEQIFPELKESEDEKIRKELLEHCKNQAKPYIQTGNKCPQIQSWIAWLEKQGEQKPANKVESKFNVGDTIIKKRNSNINDFGQFTITGITEDKYWYNDRIICDITEQDEWEIYEPIKQKPAWSEDDENLLKAITYTVIRSSFYKGCMGISNEKMIDWLQSLKNRVQPQWKPNEEHISRLETAINYLDSIGAESSKIVLTNLLEQLKKL